MKKIIFMLVVCLSVMTGYTQGLENFDNATNLPTGTNYGDGSFVGNGGITWTYVHCQAVQTYPIDGEGILLRRTDELSSISATIQGGIGNFSVDTRKGYTSNTQRKIELVINGTVVEQFQHTFPSGDSDQVVPFVVEDINIEGEFTLEIRMFGATGNQHIVLDNISWTGYTAGGGDPDSCDDLEILSVTGASVCDQGSLALEATAATENIYWYADQTGGSPIGTGASFSTPVLTETTSYWVSEYLLGDDSVTLTGQAKQEPFAASDGTAPVSTGWGLIFTATDSFVLDDVEVFITSAGGNLTVSLTDMSLNVISTTTVVAPGGTAASPTSFVIPLGFTISPGQYRLVTTAGPAMIRDFSPVFPYPIGTVGEIINGALGAGTNAAYYYFYNWTISIPEIECESERVEVIATVNETTDIAVTASEDEICAGDNTTLTVTSDNEDYQYTWEPGALTGASITVSPTETTIYTVTASDPNTGCGTEATVVVVVNSVPEELTITPSDTEVCIGTIVSLTAGAPGGSDLVYDFEGTSNEWTVVDNSSSTSIAWTIVQSPNVGISSNDSSQFFISNVDQGGTGSSVNSQLVSPSFSLLGSTEASINFFHYYRHISTTAAVEISTDGGTVYTPLVSYTTTQGGAATFQEVTLSLNNYLGESDVRIRFNYTGGWGWYWAIDNITISGAVSGATTWAPATNLYLDEAATVPYDGSEVATVYMKSENEGELTYTATLTVGTCGSVSEEITILVNETLVPEGDSEQSFPEGGATLADLEVAGDNLSWYSDEDLQNEIPDTTEVIDGETYYVTQTSGNCQSPALAITVTVIIDPCTGTEAPTGDSEQSLAEEATLADLEVAGDNLSWYSDEDLQNEIPDTTEVTDGETYYVTQTIGDCQSPALAITVTVTDPCAGIEAPTGDAEQTLIEGQTLADLEVTEDNLSWYSDEDLQNEIPDTTEVTDGETYYVTQTIGNCQSPALAITVTVTLSTGGFDNALLSAYPNPVKDFFNIFYNTDITGVMVINTLGQTVISETVNAAAAQIDMSSLPTGNYFVKVNIDGTIKTIKIIKQ